MKILGNIVHSIFHLFVSILHLYFLSGVLCIIALLETPNYIFGISSEHNLGDMCTMSKYLHITLKNHLTGIENNSGFLMIHRFFADIQKSKNFKNSFLLYIR